MRVYQNVILPAGFDCSGSYDSGFTDGFASGRTQGAAEQKAKLISTAVTANGTYTREDGYFSFTVEVPTYSGASYESGYTDGYADGYDSGVTDGYSSGYTSGKTDGYNSGYTNGYDSGNTDGKEEGFDSGFTSGYESGSTEGKEEGYESGYTAGEENQKAKLIATSVTANGVYSREDGYSSITVNVPSGSVINNQSKTYQLTKSNTQITKSVGGDYYLYGGEVITPDSGYTGLAKVTVSCIADITDLYNSGMTEGFDDGYSSGYTAGSEQTYPVAFNEGYGSGYTDGYAVGESEGFADGYESGATDAWEPAYNSGYTDGVMSSSGGSYASGYTDGYNNGYTSGNTDGKVEGFNSGYTNGKEEGFDSGYTNGYESGNTDGYASGATDGYNSGYTGGYDSGKTDGYNSGYTVGYTSGKTDGYNSGYTVGYTSGKTDGYDSGYTGGYSSGKTDGIVEQKEKLAFTAITENGTYTRNDGWSAVTVNISGYTQEDLDNAYNSGYTEGYVSGFTDGYASGSSIFSKALTFDILSSGRIYWKASNVSSVKTIEYKVNDGEWTSITSNTGDSAPYIEVAAGDEVFFRGDNAAYATDIANYSSFCGSTCNFNLKGNIMSLIDSTDFEDLDIIRSKDAFSKLFYGCTGLINAYKLNLPATTLSDNCYTAMFQACTNLVTTPELNSTTLAEGCYDLMFAGCTSLTTAPELPATALTRDCYYAMFNGCSRLMRAPELPAPTLVEGCYANMFTNCSNLNYIKCLATSITASNCTNGWVTNVASAGTFVKDINMSDWTVGNNGIPVNWVVAPTEDADVTLYINNTESGDKKITVGYPDFINTVEKMYVDDNEIIQPVSAVTFSPGAHVVKYNILGSYNSIVSGAFQNLSYINKVEIKPRPQVHPYLDIEMLAIANLRDTTTIILGNGVREIQYLGMGGDVNGTALISVVLPATCTLIGNHALSTHNNLVSINLQNTSVSTIGEQAFSVCTALSSITIPSTIQSIGNEAFLSCTGLTEITVNATVPPTLGYSVFDSTNNCNIYVPDSSVSVYKSASRWSNYASRIKGISEKV